MSKDPAFLFYPNDWLGGTMGMTAEQKGCYIDLLVLQFNNKGRFTELEAKQVLSICFTSAWQVVKNKFKNEGENNEFFYNERLREEITKRQEFSESRRINALHPKKPRKNKKVTPKAYAKHMGNENENRNISELLLNEILKRKPSFKKPDLRIWDTDVELMINKDNRSIEEIKKVIIWCQSNTFWQNNILSTTKLRKQFDQLSLKMEGEENANSRKGNSGSQQPAIKKTGNAQSDGQPYPEDRTY